MNLRIKTLRLQNFKGIKELTIDFNCLSTNIFGRNATGKTTINDAFTWLLFGKDSSGSAKFDIKPKNADGTYQHGLESMVEAVLEIDGTGTKLARVFKEKYTKKRGSITAEFTGHTTEYFIDDTPKSEKEFTAFIESIINTKTFQVITDPYFFSNDNRMKWQDRRKMLIDIIGDISDEEIINEDIRLMPLKILMQTKSVDDLRATLKSQMAKINDELKRIPDLINEAKLAMPEVQPVDDLALKQVDFHIDELESKKREMQAGSVPAEMLEALALLKADMAIERNKSFDVSANNAEVSAMNLKVYDIQGKLKDAEKKLETLERQMMHNAKTRESLRGDYARWKNAEFDESKGICSMCGQPLPDVDLDELREKFNLEKSKNLEAINTDGVELKKEFDALLQLQKQNDDEIVQLREQLKDAVNQVEEAKANQRNKIDEFNAAKWAKVDEIQKKIATAEREIEELKAGKAADVSPIEKELDEWKSRRSYLQMVIASNATAEKQAARIKDLETKLQFNGMDYQEKEKLLFLTEEFIKAKVSALTEKINSRFKLVKFKMFETQVNGGLAECCKVTVNGVDYADLNNAMKVNAGLDVINMICDHLDTYAPIFIDNCEAVNEVLATNSQQVRMYVTDTDYSLRITN